MDARQADAEMARAWAALKVGEALGPVTYHITERAADAFREAAESSHPWFAKDSPFGGRLAPPELTTTDYGHLMAGKGTNLGYHARHHAEFLAPLLVGDTLTVTGRMADVFERRGFRYYTLDYQGVNERGETAYRQSITTTVGVLRNSAYGGERRAGALGATPAHPGEFVLLRRPMTQEKMNRFASQSGIRLGREPVVHKGHHTDAGYAREVGLRGTIAQALHYVSWIGAAMAERLGKGWVAGGRLDMTFLNSVEDGDIVTVRAWGGAAKEGRRCFEVAVQNQREEMVASGEVSGTVG